MPIALEIVTVERLVFEDEVDMVIAPGGDGVMGILPNHTPLLTTLKTGELIARKNGEELLFAIGGGFMEVQPDKVIVMADAALRADEVNLQRATDARNQALTKISAGDLSAEDLEMAEGQLRYESIKMRIAQRAQGR